MTARRGRLRHQEDDAQLPMPTQPGWFSFGSQSENHPVLAIGGCFAIYPMADHFADFEIHARAEADIAKDVTSLHKPAEGRDDLIYHSTIPWIRFTSFTNAIGHAGDSIPRLVFGRSTEEAGRWRMPVSVEVHHALVDGLDVARFFDRFERGLAAFNW